MNLSSYLLLVFTVVIVGVWRPRQKVSILNRVHGGCGFKGNQIFVIA